MNTHLHHQVNQWFEQDPDPKTQRALKILIDNQDESTLTDMFSGRLAFGTAGLRGVVGPGPMAMNRLVVRQTTAGLGAYLLSQISYAASRGVIIGYDGRHDSYTFAHDAASVLTAMGFTVRLTAQVAPTPLVAFGVKHFNAAAGIVVTASHNPPQYNGYKVYWENGAQIIPPHDSGIAARIEHAATQTIPFMDLELAEEQDKLIWLKDEFYQTYRHGIHNATILQQHANTSKVSLAYTAMHGVGANMAEAVLHDAGFKQVYSVEAQREPDGDFPTVNFPNPEEEGAMDLVIAEANKHRAMLACANDPDADRFAVAVRTSDNDYKMLTGDQVGVLLGEYLLSNAPAHQRLVGTTIVSSSLLSKVAQSFHASCYTTLTGFKWLMNVGINRCEADNQFLFAYEEALGYTVGSMVWDKDGLSALVAFAQMCAKLAEKGQTVWDKLEQIYRQHGFHLNAQISIALKPDTPNIGEYLRQQPPEKIADYTVQFWDDLSQSRRTFCDGSTAVIDLPKSDVLIYSLENDARVIVRPSGTEPKIKCYYEVVESMDETDTWATAQMRAQQTMANFIKAHQASLPE
ncbi:phospho-sugar mutase [Shewanella inventionis]|uniref:Phosphoglucomutase n=1 Tax=Shewanella inventionis TaxID=1738770 RepID=A0ABQ1IQN0_9GAMM|nr:phospho-sugar mutase [Shewanella inventionis]MCL1158935.1 phospho-sugar mutase [Shewanella inventionis]UAL41883.1 phospho-sugar mutase [Shewanella inventionis]GGB48646.1 phosphoglucomutase [Shewanella inventionis]